MSHYKPYPSYKVSGVDWLGEIPEHWLVKKISSICSLSNGYPFDSTRFQPEGEPGDRLIRIRDLAPTENRMYTQENCPDSAVIVDGDILVGMDGEFNVIRWAGGVAKLNQRVCALRGKNEPMTQFLLYCLPVPLRIINDLAYSTTVKHLSSSEVLRTFAAIPPSEKELSDLVVHLDRETARIDALVEKKTRFIELLREKRHALITHAVTKGLVSNAKMRESGITWLGEVPEHWDALQLRRVASFVKTGGTPTEEQPSAEIESGFPWYTPGDFGNETILRNAEKRVSEAAVESGEAKIFPGGSVFVVSIGATLGKVGYISSPGSANQQINAVFPGPKIDGYFLAYTLSVKSHAMWYLANAATIGIMNQEKTKDIWLALPPKGEQIEICQFLDVELGRLDLLVSTTERSIELLKERRSALITAAVTGQIDLREPA